MNNKPLVSVCCITYNHENYIHDAIEGFLMQKTNFPFEIIIHDDASTDNTAAIIQEYAEKDQKIMPVLRKTNIKSTGAMVFPITYKLARGKYIALCEGDDYWTDPYKLQKQVDYMEAHPECSLCFHAAEIVNDIYKTGKFIRASKRNTVFDQKKLFGFGNDHPTASLLLRKEYIIDIPKWFLDAPVGDVPLKLLLSQKGQIYYLNEVMSGRRITVKNSWNERIWNNPEKRIDYRKGIIKMLQGFDVYTNNKYSYQVMEKKLAYTLRMNHRKNRLDRLQLLRKGHKLSYKALPIKIKLKLLIICLFPRLGAK